MDARKPGAKPEAGDALIDSLHQLETEKLLDAVLPPPSATPKRAKAAEQAPRTDSAGGGAAPAPEGESPGLATAAAWGARGLEGLKNLGKRLFTHLAIAAAAVAAGFADGSVLTGLCMYVGGICILARGMTASPEWLIPAVCGALQALVLVLFGIPLPQALFWGGAQAWLQRLVQKRFSMGAEWVVLLLLAPIGIQLLPGAPVAPLCASFAGLAAIGVALSRAAIRRRTAGTEAPRPPTPPEPERIAAYRASLAEFNAKIGQLPAGARAVAASIAARTGGILDAMAADPRDREPGHRFLNRYFKAAHGVVDRHASLAREEQTTPELREALAKSEEMLGRLDAVFAREQARLLENDVSDFSADLAVIDTLLKMDGR